MKRARNYKIVLTAFFIGVLCTTVFIQNTGFKRKFSSRSAGYALIVKTESSDNQKQNPFGSNLVSEEEEETHVKIDEMQVPEKHFFTLVSVSFSSLKLFFKEHFLDVTSPPPWA